MCWDGREVDSCRNWSAKNRGATVVSSLWGRDQAASQTNLTWALPEGPQALVSPEEAGVAWPALDTLTWTATAM